MPCNWSKEEICQILTLHPSGKPLACNGHHSACLGQAGKVRDKRDLLDSSHPNFPSPGYPPGKPGMAILRLKPPPKPSWKRYKEQISHQTKEGDQLPLPELIQQVNIAPGHISLLS